MIIGLVLIHLLSNMIFSIEIIHSNSKIIKLLEDELNYHGIKKFSMALDYDKLEEIEEQILNDNKDSLDHPLKILFQLKMRME